MVTINSAGESKLAKVEDIKKFIQQRITDTLSASLHDIGVKYGTPQTEKLLWELLNILVDTEGSVSILTSMIYYMSTNISIYFY